MPSTLLKLLLIGLAGGLGTLARYGLDGFVQSFISLERRGLFPWGILVVNLLGCLIFGILVSVFEGRWAFRGDMKPILLTGFLGGFTTFSTYMFELTGMLQDHEWLPAVGNFALHNVGGVVAIAIGLILGRLL